MFCEVVLNEMFLMLGIAVYSYNLSVPENDSIWVPTEKKGRLYMGIYLTKDNGKKGDGAGLLRNLLFITS